MAANPKDIWLKNSTWFSAFLLFLAVQIPYLNALPNEFLWDDEVLILQNSLIRGWNHLAEIFGNGLFEASGNYYRPLSLFTYVIDHELFGLNSFGFHLTQNIWHGLVCVAFYLLLRTFFPGWISFFGALLYGLHPVHGGQVLALAGRCGILEGFWVFALYWVARSAKDLRFAALALLCYALALLSKESSVLFPVLALALSYLFFSGTERKRAFITTAALACMAAFYLVARATWLPIGGEQPLSMIAQAHLPIRLWTALSSITQYAALILFPVFLRTERHFVETSTLSLWPWIGLVLVICAASLAWRSRHRHPHLSFGLVWFFLFLVPALNIWPLPVTMSEHWLYLPLMGVIWIFAWGLTCIPEISSRKIMWAISVVAALCAGRVFVRAYDYRDGFTLYSTDVQNSPNSFLLHTNLGVELFRRNQLPEAKVHFEEALKLMPSYGTAANNLGVILQREGNKDDAKRLYKMAIEGSRYSLAYRNLAGIFMQENNRAGAEDVLEQGVAAYPHDEGLRQMLGVVRAKK